MAKLTTKDLIIPRKQKEIEILINSMIHLEIGKLLTKEAKKTLKDD
jgi:hypothetical protein